MTAARGSGRGGAGRALRESALLLAAALLCAAAAWAARSPRLPLRADARRYALDLEFPVLDAARALEAYRANAALFVDVRADGEHGPEHIPGAFTLRAATFDDDLLAIHDFLTPGDPLVLYGDGNLLVSGAIAARLKSRGFSEVRLMAGDLDAWRRAGGPVSGGAAGGGDG